MGAHEGSPWTGEQDADCETDCGWHDDTIGCIVPGDLSGMLLREADVDPQDPEFTNEMPDCRHAESCQWQQQGGDTPCPPRLAVMLDLDPTMCQY